MEKKRFFGWLLASLVVLVGLPAVTRFAAPAEAGMMAMWISLMGLDPMFFGVLGYDVGKNFKARWPMPLIAMLLFVLANVVLFGIPPMAQLTYLSIYLATLLVAMGLSAALNMRRPDHF